MDVTHPNYSDGGHINDTQLGRVHPPFWSQLEREMQAPEFDGDNADKNP